MLIPYAVDVPFDRRPFVNWLLVGSVVAAFVFQLAAYDTAGEDAIEAYVLEGWGIQGLFGHMWLHGDIFHLGGNMLFLWIFGNAVCAKVGNLKYLPVYLILGLGAAITHLMFDGDPAIGASGAINGIVGMFLIFFWENEVHCLFGYSLYIRRISISSFWLIGLWLVYDIWGAVAGGGRVAYYAHLGGFLAGVVAAIALVKLNLVTMYRDEQSLVGLFEEWRENRQDAKLMRKARDEIDNARQQGDTGSVGSTGSIPQPIAVDSSGPDESPLPIPEPIVIPQAKSVVPATKPQMPNVLRFACSCGKRIKVPMKHAGKKGRCPQCRQAITIPIPTAEEL